MRRRLPAYALALAAGFGLGLAAAQGAHFVAGAQSVAEPDFPLQWTLDFPQGAPARVGEAVPVQLRFYNASGASITLPCVVPQPPAALVREAADAAAGADGKAQWLTLTPIWDAPQCSGGTLTFAAGKRGQYRAQFAAPRGGEYLLRGLWSGVGNLGELQAGRSFSLP